MNTFGMSLADLDLWIADAVAKGTDPQKLAMSMLSDAQELIDMDRKVRATQNINIAKYILLEHLKVK